MRIPLGSERYCGKSAYDGLRTICCHCQNHHFSGVEDVPQGRKALGCYQGVSGGLWCPCTCTDTQPACLTKVKAHIASPGKFEETDFSVVEALLLNLGDIVISTTKEMLELIKIVAYIPRPYSGRIATLVKSIYYVDQFSRKDKNKSLTGYRHNLKEYVSTIHCLYTDTQMLK